VSLEQSHLFPDLLPEIVVRIWQAARRHYATGTHRTMTRIQLVKQLEADPGKPASTSTVDRARHDYPKFLPWPIKRGQLPPWETQPEILADLTDATPPVTTTTEIHRIVEFGDDGTFHEVQVISDSNGLLRLASHVRHILPALIAGTFGFVLIDVMSDGRADGLIRWCMLLGQCMRIKI
jgi:hypothetical protein